MNVTPEHIISAIIGHWRNGASFSEINNATGVPISIIKKLILFYEAASKYIEREA